MSKIFALYVSLVLALGSSTAIANDGLRLGLFKSLVREQTRLYYDSQWIALHKAKPGESVTWENGNAAGYTKLLVVDVPSSNTVCKTLYSVINAYNTDYEFKGTACYTNFTQTWEWVQSPR